MNEPKREPDFSIEYCDLEKHHFWMEEGILISHSMHGQVLRYYIEVSLSGKLLYKNRCTEEPTPFGKEWHDKPQQAYNVWLIEQILLCQ